MTKWYEPDPTLTPDESRLAAVVMLVDGIGDIDLHERAAQYSARRASEPDERDYCNAVRDAIDAMRTADGDKAGE